MSVSPGSRPLQTPVTRTPDWLRRTSPSALLLLQTRAAGRPPVGLKPQELGIEEPLLTIRKPDAENTTMEEGPAATAGLSLLSSGPRRPSSGSRAPASAVSIHFNGFIIGFRFQLEGGSGKRENGSLGASLSGSLRNEPQTETGEGGTHGPQILSFKSQAPRPSCRG